MATWAWSFNGLTWGEGTSIDITGVDGLDLPNVRVPALRYANGDGQVSGTRTYDPRAVTFGLEFTAASAAAFETLLDTIRRAFKRTTAEGTLVVELPGQVAKRLYCHVERRTQPIDGPWSYLFVSGMSVQFVADDPLFYAETATVTDLNPGGGAVAIPNAGDEATKHWSAVIVGPATSPVITHANGTVLDFTGYVLGAAQTITLDGRAFTAVRETGADVRGSLTSASDFFTIAAGGETLTFTASGTTGATDLDVTTRAAWASLT